MASLDSLPPDQRAVLQLVLQRGRSYDEIARMLSIDRAAVRERALSAFDALGPSTRVSPQQRALITDYLLGQLPERVADDTRNRLADSAADRAWARVVASEIGQLSNGPLPEIPVGTAAAQAPAPADALATAQAPIAPDEPATHEAPAPAPAVAEESEQATPTATEQPVPAAAEAPSGPQVPQPPSGRPSSRRGGVVLLAVLGAILVAAIVVAIISLTGGSSSKHSSSTNSSVASNGTTTAPSTSTPTASSGTTTTSPTTSTSTTSTATATRVGQALLKSPSGNKNVAGAAVVVAQGAVKGIVIRATGLPANSSHDAYAVWLYNSPTDAVRLGFVNPGVKADGLLQAESPLPTNASHFKTLLITLETQAKPHAPGKIVLSGPLKIQ
jgi:Sigma-70, region 4/Anti-sigma-K factor rskA, C-terminal